MLLLRVWQNVLHVKVVNILNQLLVSASHAVPVKPLLGVAVPV
jgi:hypothetical protein